VTGARIVLYTKAGCTLCEEARAQLDAWGEPYDVAEDPRYAFRVPVVTVDGRIVTEGRIRMGAVRRAVRRRSARWFSKPSRTR
jgi:hypothetical protein